MKIIILFSRKKKNTTQLTVVSVQATDIPPKEPVTYAKQTQTVNTGPERDGEYPAEFFIYLKNCKKYKKKKKNSII